MDYQIRWLPQAEKRYDEIIKYLQDNWDEKVIAHFILTTQRILEQVKRKPTLFRRSAKMDIYEVF